MKRFESVRKTLLEVIRILAHIVDSHASDRYSTEARIEAQIEAQREGRT